KKAAAPARSPGSLRLQRDAHDLVLDARSDAARTTRARAIVLDPGETFCLIAIEPALHLGPGQPELSADLLRRRSVRGGQQDPSSLTQSSRNRLGSGALLEDGAITT